MSLKYGLLGFLSEQPRTGYELHKLYPAPVRPTIAYIYRALTNLAKEGLVESTRVAQEKRPNRNVFRITKAGLAELDKWLETPLDFVPPRNTFLVQIWFGRRVGKEKLIANIKAYREQIKTNLEAFNNWPEWKSLLRNDRSKRDIDLLYRTLTLETSVNYLNAQLNWLDSLTKKIMKIDDSGR